MLVTQGNRLKITDFGLSYPRLRKVQGVVGTTYYMAPEVAANLVYDYRADIWSVGVCFFAMMTGSFPYRGRSLARLQESIMRQDFDHYRWPSELRGAPSTLCCKFLDLQPKRRPSLTQALTDPFLRR